MAEDVEVRFLPLYSPEADALGAELAPALVINRKRLVEGIPSVEEIKALIQESLPTRLGIILTKAPVGSEHADNALTLGLQALAEGGEAAIFCLSDGVWLAKRSLAGSPDGRLVQFLAQGGKVCASGEHLRAAGLSATQLWDRVEVAEDGYDRLVDLIMEEWDKVVAL